MGRFSCINIREIISSCKFALQLQNSTEWDDFFELFGREAVRELRCLSIFIKKQKTLPIVDNKVKLPDNFYQLIALRFHGNQPAVTGAGGQLIQHILYADKKFLNSCGLPTNSNGVNDFNQTFQFVGNYIHFNSTTTASQVDLAYIGFNTGEDEQLVIYDKYERAVRSYMAWKFCTAWHEKYPVNIREQYRKEWCSQKALIKGSDVLNDYTQDKREFLARSVALVTSPITSW